MIIESLQKIKKLKQNKKFEPKVKVRVNSDSKNKQKKTRKLQN